MIDAEKTLRLLAELWAHQNGLKIESIKITKKEQGGQKCQ